MTLNSSTPVPWLTVLLCVRNGEDFLADALESLAWQTDQTFEFIAVDDNSTDGTMALLADHPRVDQLISGPGMGLGAARNVGIAAATGRYITFIDHDDLYHPERVANLKQIVAEYPTTKAFTTGLLSFATRDEVSSPPYFTDLGPGYPEFLVDAARLREVVCSNNWLSSTTRRPPILRHFSDSLYWSAGGSTLLVDRTILGVAGGFPTHLSYGEDQVAVQNILRLTAILEVDEPSYLYRIRSDSMAQGAGAVWSYAAAMVDLRLGSADRSTGGEAAGRFWTLELLLSDALRLEPNASTLMTAVALLRVLYPNNRSFISAAKQMVVIYVQAVYAGPGNARSGDDLQPQRARRFARWIRGAFANAERK